MHENSALEQLSIIENFVQLWLLCKIMALMFQQPISSLLAYRVFKHTTYDKKRYIGHNRWNYLTIQMWSMTLCQQVWFLNVSEVKVETFPFADDLEICIKSLRFSRVHYVYLTNWTKYDSRCKQFSNLMYFATSLIFVTGTNILGIHGYLRVKILL